MKTRSLKNAHEERVFNLFKKHLGLELVSHDKSESPDFILHQGSGDIGVEIVELLEPDKKMESSVKSKLTENVIKRLKTKLPYPFTLNIDFVPKNKAKPNINKREMELVAIFEELGRDLEDLGQLQFDKFDGDFEEFPEDVQKKIIAQGFMPLPSGVTRINFARFDSLEYSFNSQREGGLVPLLKVEKIQNEIDKKNNKMPNYQKFSEHWLILEEGNGMPGYYDNIPNHAIFNTTFDRVFIIRLFKNVLVELNIKKLMR
jgi:hypothetical protein